MVVSRCYCHKQAGRGVLYDLWQLGRWRLAVRSRQVATMRETGQGVVVASKMEYLGDQGREQVTVGELARWWAHMQLQAQAELLVRPSYDCWHGHVL